MQMLLRRLASPPSSHRSRKFLSSKSHSNKKYQDRRVMKNPYEEERQVFPWRQQQKSSAAAVVTEYRILALYRFVPLVSLQNKDQLSIDNASLAWDEQTLMNHPERHPDLAQLQSELYTMLRKYETRGTLLIAPEGINGTICYPYPPPSAAAGSSAATASEATAVDDSNEYESNQDDDPVASFLCNHPLFGGPGLRTRSSVWKDDNREQAFQRLKIKIKPEIVTLGLGRPMMIHNDNHSSLDTAITAAAQQQNQRNNRHEHNQLANPNIIKGHYLTPHQWDTLAIQDPNVLVIDTRNTYEIEIGTFENAVNPNTDNFSDFPSYLEKLADEFDWCQQKPMTQEHEKGAGKEECDNDSIKNTPSTNTKKKKEKKPPPKAIAMFCTGGIRCEKATSYAIQSNLFPKNLPIYHLEGGILSYLDEVAKRRERRRIDNEEQEGGGDGGERSTFQGECFVFDKRVAVTEGLQPSTRYVKCYGCRGPMDRRLIEDTDENDSSIIQEEDNNNDVDCDADIKKKKREEYEQLLIGIRNLPPLTYDITSSKWYIPGLTCPRCHDGTSRESLERFVQRKNQMEICEREGKSHFQDNGPK